jgi:GAF domain-containing protein
LTTLIVGARSDPHRQLRVVAASSEDAELMELLQLQNEQGPCLDCYRTGAPVSVPDLAHAAPQWPGFAAAVEEAGAFRSVHALPLRLRGEAIGALNLFHRTPGPLPEADLLLGQALADVATIGILQERAIRRSEVLTEQLQTALTSRVVVEQAKGVLASTTTSAWTSRSTGYAATAVTTTCGWPKSPASSPPVNSTRKPSQDQPRPAPDTESSPDRR